MGALVSAGQKVDVLEKAALIRGEAERVFGDSDQFSVQGESVQGGAFFAADAMSLR